jgi:hypothetical protein
MNFVAGFILLLSGGDEESTFSFLVSLLETKIAKEPKMDGLRGLYKAGFPLLHKYTSFFNKIFSRTLPKLYAHFDLLQIPSLLWLTKWI